MRDINTLIAAGINPKNGLPYKCDDNDCQLKESIKQALSIYDKQGKIFDQRDFMIMPEQAPERNTMIDRLYQSTKCNCENKPTSMIDREIM